MSVSRDHIVDEAQIARGQAGVDRQHRAGDAGSGVARPRNRAVRATSSGVTMRPSG